MLLVHHGEMSVRAPHSAIPEIAEEQRSTVHAVRIRQLDPDTSFPEVDACPSLVLISKSGGGVCSSQVIYGQQHPHFEKNLRHEILLNVLLTFARKRELFST
jgi:hypothetical protein